MASGTPTFIKQGAPAPVRSAVRGDFRQVIKTVLGNYVTGGVVLTLPTKPKGVGKLRAASVLNPVPEAGVDRIYSWNGSDTAPKIVAKVISTGAEVANGTATSTAPLVIELIYGA